MTSIKHMNARQTAIDIRRKANIKVS